MILPVACPQPADATASWGVTTPRPVSTGPREAHRERHRH
jgi:hypothetical protein